MIRALSLRSCTALHAQSALRFFYPGSCTFNWLEPPSILRLGSLQHYATAALSPAAARRERLPLQISRASSAMAALEDLTYLCDALVTQQVPVHCCDCITRVTMMTERDACARCPAFAASVAGGLPMNE